MARLSHGGNLIKKDMMRIAHRMGSRVVADVLDKILVHTPVEDGHAHEAWIEAGLMASKKLSRMGGGNEIEQVAVMHHSKASGDPLATQEGIGTVERTDTRFKVRLENNLPFVRALELGLTIRPIMPGGPKMPPVAKRPGQKGALYARRETDGTGMLYWTDASGKGHYTRTRRPKAGRYVKRAVEKTRKLLKSRKAV